MLGIFIKISNPILKSKTYIYFLDELKVVFIEELALQPSSPHQN